MKVPKLKQYLRSIRMEFVDELIGHDGDPIAVAILADDLIHVNNAVTKERKTNGIAVAMSQLRREFIVRAMESLPEADRQRYEPGFREAVRKIMKGGAA